MYGILLLAVGLGAAVATPNHGMPVCGRVLHGGLECCKKDITSYHDQLPSDDIKECMSLPRKPPQSCEIEKCIAKKRGFSSEDGKLDMSKIQKSIEEKYKNDPDLSSSIVANCIKGDLSKFGPADICDSMKLKLCEDVQTIKSCDEWDDEGDCKGMQDLADQCVGELQ